MYPLFFPPKNASRRMRSKKVLKEIVMDQYAVKPPA